MLLGCLSWIVLMLAIEVRSHHRLRITRTNDLMAIAFLLTRKDVKIEAITVADGLAYVQAGRANVPRLLAVSSAGDVPVYLGKVNGAARADEAVSGGVAANVTIRCQGCRCRRVRGPTGAANGCGFPGKAARGFGARGSHSGAGPLTNLGEAIPARAKECSGYQRAGHHGRGGTRARKSGRRRIFKTA